MDVVSTGGYQVFDTASILHAIMESRNKTADIRWIKIIYGTEPKESNIIFIVVLLILINWDSDERVEDDVNKYTNRLEFVSVDESVNMVWWFDIFNKNRPVLGGILLFPFFISFSLSLLDLNGIVQKSQEDQPFLMLLPPLPLLLSFHSIHSLIHLSINYSFSSSHRRIMTSTPNLNRVCVCWTR